MNLNDVNVELRIVIGETSMLIKDILQLNPGSIVELDKYANEPVDVYINNKLYARGEVVSVNDNYGVRINEIIEKGV